MRVPSGPCDTMRCSAVRCDALLCSAPPGVCAGDACDVPEAELEGGAKRPKGGKMLAEKTLPPPASPTNKVMPMAPEESGPESSSC